MARKKAVDPSSLSPGSLQLGSLGEKRLPRIPEATLEVSHLENGLAVQCCLQGPGVEARVVRPSGGTRRFSTGTVFRVVNGERLEVATADRECLTLGSFVVETRPLSVQAAVVA